MLHLNIIKNFKKKIGVWVTAHYINLAIFNGLTIILVLLHSAGYFDPFWTISINVIIFTLLVASVVLLGAGCGTLFAISLAFLVFAGLMRVLEIDVWAERTTIYVFESLLIGVFLLFIENLKVYINLDKIWKSLKH